MTNSNFSKNISKIFWGTKIIDTIKEPIEHLFIQSNFHPFTIITTGNNILIFNLKNRELKITKIESDNGYPITLMNDNLIFYKESYFNNIPYIVFNSFSIDQSMFIKSIKCKLPVYSNSIFFTYAGSYFSPISKKILIITGIDSGDGEITDPFKGIIFDIESDKYITNALPDSFDIKYMTELTPFSDYKSFRSNYLVNDNMGNILIQKNYILNSDFVIVRETVPRKTFVIKGYCNENDKITGTFVLSSTDNRLKNVIININNTEHFDYIQNMIFHEKNVSGTLDSLTKDDLETLRNFIFAKHNQKFDDEYYQAYFNTFVFYSDESMRKSRLPDVTHLLTPADKQNLALINEALEKIK